MANHARVLFAGAGLIVIIAVLAMGCTSTTAPATPSTVATTAPAGSVSAVTIQNFAFSQATITVAAGTTVTWTNKDGTAHTVTSDSGDPVAFDSGSIAPGGTYQFTFTQTGVYPYHCTYHPHMTGTVTVQ